MKKELIHTYTSGPVFRSLLNFAWPFMLSYLLQTTYNLTDMIVVGQYVGATGLSAVSIGGELIHLYTFVAMGFCNAGQILISQYIGIGDRESLGRVFSGLAKIVCAVAVIITILGTVLLNSIMVWMQVPAEALEQCRAYSFCSTCGCVFIFGYNMICSVFRGMGDSRHPMIFIAIASVVNIILDIVLVSAGMGALGAALATVIAQAISFIFSLMFLFRNRNNLGFSLKKEVLRQDGEKRKMILKLGFPLMLQSCALSISNLVVLSYVNSYGLTASALTGVGSKLTTVMYIVSIGMMQAGNTFVGQNFAARLFSRVKKVLWSMYSITIFIALVLSVLMILFPQSVFRLFTEDADVLAVCGTYVPVAVLNFFGSALRSPSVSLCNGMGFVKMNLLLGIIDGIVMRLGLSFLLGLVLEMGIQGFWYGSAIAGFTYFFVMFPYFLQGGWQKRSSVVTANR